MEDVEHALAGLAVERGRAVVTQPVVVEIGGLAAGEYQFQTCLGDRDR
jgi:hypothetical protein